MLKFGLNYIVKQFKNGSVAVTGSKGSGKDLITSNVVIRRKEPYVSNVDYGGDRYPLDLDALNLPDSYVGLLKGEVKRYVFPYPDGTDIYISDCGVYFPSQYFKELNARIGGLSTFMCLSRHLGNCSVHTNCQQFSRVYDKIREHSDVYIRCNRSRVFFGKIAITRATFYDRPESMERNIPPYSGSIPLFGIKRQLALMAKQAYTNTHGDIKRHTFIYLHRSKYDTRFFKKIYENGHT